jgi:translation initiation factor 2 beta subunit (eIF-2beta)/eIF-5
MNIYTIKCKDCGKGFGARAAKRSEVRAMAKQMGWTVAIPEWATIAFIRIAEKKEISRHRRTFDVCPECMKNGTRFEVERIGRAQGAGGQTNFVPSVNSR